MFIKKRRALACNSVLPEKNHTKFVKICSQKHPQNLRKARELHEKDKAEKIAIEVSPTMPVLFSDLTKKGKALEWSSLFPERIDTKFTEIDLFKHDENLRTPVARGKKGGGRGKLLCGNFTLQGFVAISGSKSHFWKCFTISKGPPYRLKLK